jgi:hypothetical protein
MNEFIGDHKCFTPENLKKIVDEKQLTSIANLEKALFALEYVGQLWNNGVDLVFKGGSAVQILLGGSWNRLSVDVDVCTEVSVKEIERNLYEIKKKFEGKCFDYETRGDPDRDLFRFYRLTSLPISGPQRRFLLDIQRIEPDYHLTETPLKSFFYDSDLIVKTPTGSSILGDKLSVIGPLTIGRKLEDSRNGIEYAKHFYDIFCLSNNFEEFSETRKTYDSCVEIQSEIRQKNYSREECIEDGLLTCKIASLPFNEEIVNNMSRDDMILKQYEILKKGVHRFGPFMVGERFYTWESLREYASKTANLFKALEKGIEKPKKEDVGLEEMIETLSALPREERWFMDFDDLRLSPEVIKNWYQFYTK